MSDRLHGRAGSGTHDAAEASPLLATMLEPAVMIAVHELREVPFEQIMESRSKWLEDICARGDILQYGGGEEGEVAETFASVARAVAALSFAPGGVSFLGMRFDNEHPELKGEKDEDEDQKNDDADSGGPGGRLDAECGEHDQCREALLRSPDTGGRSGACGRDRGTESDRACSEGVPDQKGG